MAAEDVQETLDEALAATGLDQAQVRCRPRLLSDNGPCYVSKDLREYLEERGMAHTRGKPYHPQTQGKIKRYHVRTSSETSQVIEEIVGVIWAYRKNAVSP